MHLELPRPLAAASPAVLMMSVAQGGSGAPSVLIGVDRGMRDLLEDLSSRVAALEARSRFSHHLLSALGVPEAELTRPIGVSIEETPDGYVVSALDLGVFAYGGTFDEALRTFCHALVEEAQFLRDNVHNLGDDLAARERRLRELLVLSS